MAYTEVKAISADSGRFNALLQAAITAGFQPVSKITVNGSQSYSIVVAKGADSSITEARVITSANMRKLFEDIEVASNDGFTIDTSSLSLSPGQFFAYAYKGSSGGAVSVSWADVTGKPSTFAPIIGTGANQAMPGNKFVAGAAVADVENQTVTGTEAAEVVTSATTAVNAVATKVNDLLAQLRVAKIIAS
ncbi:TPA: hypothetical protein IF905_004991 [Escherichia coli]|nr:hypothetical protein [Escherichia coli]